MTDNCIRITQVRSRRDIENFIDIPYVVYRGDPNWVAPLRREMRKLLSVRHNPFFDHGVADFWIAWRGRDPVGRISAQINRLHIETYKDATGNFGLIEAIDDPAVFCALLGTAEDWLRARGMHRLFGPYNLSINDEIGVLIKGFDASPMIMMPYSQPYYAPRLEECGYRKAKDLHAYAMNLQSMPASEVQRLEAAAAKLRSDGRMRIRPIDMGRFADEIKLAIEIYNDAWQDNWEFLAVTPREVDYLIAAIRPIAMPDGVLFAEVDGKPEAMIICIPNLNEIISDLDGKLFPFGWLRLLWRIRTQHIKSARMILAGVRKARRDSLMSGALITMMLAELTKAGLARGIEEVEFSWILEDNQASLAVARYGNAKLRKLYRIYQKSLLAS